MPGPYGVLDKIKGQDDYKYYEAIYNLLNTGDGMRICRQLLRELGKKVSTGADLHKELRGMETKMGLFDVRYLKGVAGAFYFFQTIGTKKAIIDNGAYAATNGDHGANTHRLQWWLVCKAAEGNLLNGVQLSAAKVGDLYKGLGTAPIKDLKTIANGRDQYVWDDVVDLQENTYKAPKSGTTKAFGHPEWFCGTWLAGKQDGAKGKSEEQVAEYKQLAKAFFEAEQLAMAEQLTA